MKENNICRAFKVPGVKFCRNTVSKNCYTLSYGVTKKHSKKTFYCKSCWAVMKKTQSHITPKV
jgi:hypothetical protein